MEDQIKTVSLKPVFTVYTDEDGLYYAVRNFSPKFCLSAPTALAAAEKATEAMAFHATLEPTQ